MKDFVISSTVGIVNNEILLDLIYDEQKNSTAYIVVSYLPRTDEIDFMELKCSKV